MFLKLYVAEHASLKTCNNPNDCKILGQCRQHLAATVIHVEMSLNTHCVVEKIKAIKVTRITILPW